MVALKEGYSKAYSAIIDANLTTLLTAFVLYSFGSGAIRGFATTLIIGIFTSLFSAIVLTRLIFFTRLENKKGISFYTEATKNWFTNTAIDFIGKRRRFYLLSGLLVAGGLASLMSRGLNQGVEFTGGTTFDISFEEAVDPEVVRGALAEAFTEDGVPGNPLVQTKDSAEKLRIMTNFMIDSEAEDVDEQINAALASGLASVGGDYTVDMYNKVDSTISDDFRKRRSKRHDFLAHHHLLYIFFRFRKWQYGFGCIGGHDARRHRRVGGLLHLLGHPPLHHGN